MGSGLFVLFTNQLAGRVVAESLVSANSGVSWAGPYPAFPPSGSIQDPAAVAEPDGDVLATWRDSGNGSWQVDQALFSANGTLLTSVKALPGSGGDTSSGYSAGPPAVTVDWLGRPIYAWTNTIATAGPAIEYSGDFLSPAASLNTLNQLDTDPLVPADFSPASQGSQQSFDTSVAAAISATRSDLNTTGIKNLGRAQNETLNSTIPAVTHVVLHVSGSVQPSKSTTNLANTTGAFSPNIYLAVAAANLLNALGIGVTNSPLSLVSNLGPYSGPVPLRSFSNSAEVDSELASVSVTPTPQSPATVLLSASPGFPEYTNQVDYQCINGKIKGGLGDTYYSIPVEWWANVSLAGGAVNHFSSASGLPSVYLTNLTPSTNFTWSGTYAAAYAEYVHEYSLTCDINMTLPVSPDTLGPLSISFSLAGWAVTALGVTVPSNGYLLSGDWVAGSSSPPTLTAYWNNTMLAKDGIWLNTTGSTSSWTNSQYAIVEKTTPFSGLKNASYTGQVFAQSEPGTYNSSDLPAVSYGPGHNYPPQQASLTCSFNLTPPWVQITSGPTATDVFTSTEEVQWTATSAGLGSVTYYEYGTGNNFTIAGIPALKVSGQSLWNYYVVLHGLDDFAVYYYAASIGVGSGCIEKSLSSQSSTFRTPAVLTLTEWDQAYDSITRMGGGATIAWQVPPTFASKATFRSGVLFWSNSSTTVQVPLTNESQFEINTYTGWIHLVLPRLNTSYTVWVDLNYTLGPGYNNPVNVTSIPASFDYLRDTSGDGLTDLEKGLGWNEPVSTVTGSTQVEHFSANPPDYATNGLVNDYVEKEYGLNPHTVDTAGSRMLDTWNLTFDLGTNASNPLPPAIVHAWWEVNNSFNPFSYAPYPGGRSLGGTPLNGWGNDLSNLSCTPARCPGDSPYSAEVLWSKSALSTFLNFSGVSILAQSSDWLRGVLGVHNGERTLTLWGKLSWGANPLASSTPNDDLADGQRVNPLHEVGLEFNPVFANASVTGWAERAFAVNMSYSYRSPSGALRQVTNYSSEAWYNGGSPSSISDYAVTLPVGQASQYQTVCLSVVFNIGTHPFTSVAINGNNLTFNVTYDLVSAAERNVSLWGSNASAGRGNLHGTFQEVPMGVKAPTWLWIPTDNSTVNGLPTGLERYTGEQSFDMVVVNVSGTNTPRPIPYPWGGSYRITLQPGLNDFLIPREQFFNSPFGEAIFEGKSLLPASNYSTPPIVGEASNDSLVLTKACGGTAAGPMYELGAYWQNRSVLPNGEHSGNFTVVNQTGTGGLGSYKIEVMEASTTLANNTGGVVQDPAIYSTEPAPPALQVMVTLNITAPSYLDLLLASLLDNTTGGVNGTFQLITNQVGFLGICSSVVNAISNLSQVSDGLYGPPTVIVPRQSSGFWGIFWNDVTSVFTNPAGTVLSLINITWNFATAANTYFNHLFHEAVAIGGKILSRVAATLVSVGRLIASVLSAFLAWLAQQISKLLAPVVSPIVNAAQSFDGALSAATNATVGDVASGGSVTPGHGLAWARAFDPAGYLGLVLAAALMVGLTLVLPFALGAGFVITVLLGLLPSFAQHLVPGMNSVFALTSLAVDDFETSFTNTISKTDWSALAESVAIAASTDDFVWWSFVALPKVGAEAGLTALTLSVSIIIDAVILMFALANTDLNLPAVYAGLAFLALFSVLAATATLLGPLSVGTKPYAEASEAIAGLGLAVVGAELLHDGLL